jgi:uncharacterized protein (DUF885 family)
LPESPPRAGDPNPGGPDLPHPDTLGNTLEHRSFLPAKLHRRGRRASDVALLCRPLDAYGLDFYSDDLEDYSPAGDLAILDQLSEIHSGLRAYDRDSLSTDQQLSYDVLDWLLETQEAGRPFLYHDYPLNQFDGAQSRLPDFLVNIHQVDDETDARNYLARVEKFDLALEQMSASVRARAERGFLPPRFVLNAVEQETAAFAATPVEENVLFSKFADSLDEISNLPDSTNQELLAELSSLIREVVQTGFRRLAQTLSELAAGASDDDGVWKHPDGEAYYHWALRWHTTTNQGPEEIHQIGPAEIERYIVAPGQACAYKMGQLKILELRARAKAGSGMTSTCERSTIWF